MRKLIPLLSVAVVLGVAFVGYRLWGVGDQLSQAASNVDTAGTRDSIPAPATRPAATDAVTPEVRRPDEASVAATSPLPGDEVPDQFGPDGHDANRQARRADEDLGGEPATLSGDPDDTLTPEAAALADAKATLEVLLKDPDPAVREQAAALLELAASGSP